MEDQKIVHPVHTVSLSGFQGQRTQPQSSYDLHNVSGKLGHGGNADNNGTLFLMEQKFQGLKVPRKNNFIHLQKAH